MTAKTGRMYNPQEPFLIVQSLIIQGGSNMWNWYCQCHKLGPCQQNDIISHSFFYLTV